MPAERALRAAGRTPWRALFRAAARLVLAALAAGLGADSLPAAPVAGCSQGFRVLARSGSGRLADGGPQELRLSFHLSSARTVWAEAGGLAGLDAEDRDAAPEAFVDDHYLGSLLAEQGQDWRSSQSFTLQPGDHVFLLRRAQAASGPAPRWDTLEVVADEPCIPPHQSPPARAADCGSLTEHREWPARLHGRALVLSVLSGRMVPSGALVHLRDGQRWRALIKIPPGADGQPLPLLAGFDPRRQGTLRFMIWLDQQSQGPVSALGYRPGSWETLSLALCGGVLRAQIAGVPAIELPWARSGADLELAAQDLELSIKMDPAAAGSPTRHTTESHAPATL